MGTVGRKSPDSVDAWYLLGNHFGYVTLLFSKGIVLTKEIPYQLAQQQTQFWLRYNTPKQTQIQRMLALYIALNYSRLICTFL
jgi:hypothetical protein